MGCCGQGRNQPPAGLRAAQPRRDATLPATREAARGIMLVEYTGHRAIRVTGPATGRRYTFPARGSQVWIDERDAAGVLAVAQMRAVR